MNCFFHTDFRYQADFTAVNADPPGEGKFVYHRKIGDEAFRKYRVVEQRFEIQGTNAGWRVLVVEETV